MPEIIVGDVPARVQYLGDGQVTDFPVPFPLYDQAELLAWLDGEPLAEMQVLTPLPAAASSLRILPAPAAGQRVTLMRAAPLARHALFQTGGEFRADAIQDELNRIAMLVQQLDDEVRRSLRVAPWDVLGPLPRLPPPGPGFLRWNSAGTLLELDAAAEQSVVTAGTSAAAAATSAGLAEDSATAAAASAGAAADSAAAAAASAGLAGDSATASTASAGASATSAAAAGDSATASAASAGAAEDSATASAASAGAAEDSATASAASAGAAEDSAAAAAASAGASAASAAAAESGATASATSAGVAGDNATASAASAAAAAANAAAAQISATAAAASAAAAIADVAAERRRLDLVAMAEQLHPVLGADVPQPVFGIDFQQRRNVEGLIVTRDSIATYFDEAGIMRLAQPHEPRLDHDPATGAPRGLLIEDQRLNVLAYSADFGHPYWHKAFTATAVNAAIAPDGTLTADKLVPGTTSSEHFHCQMVLIPTGQPCCLTVFAKAAGNTKLRLRAAAGLVCDFDLQAGTVTLIEGEGGWVEPIGDGWFRCGARYIGDGIAGLAGVGMLSAAGNPVFAGDGVAGIHCWGAQLELGLFPTSYIPTGASGQTRLRDQVRVEPVAPWHHVAEGTLFAEFRSFGQGVDDFGVAALVDPATWESVVIRRNTAGAVKGEVSWQGQAQFTLSLPGAAPEGEICRVALAYRAGDYALAAGGATPLTTAGGPVAQSAVMLRLGAGTYNSQPLNGYLRRLLYWRRRLTNATLTALTA